MIVSEEKILQALENGEVVGIPTDTVYGLAVLKEYENSIYELKKRDFNKKLISFIYSYKQIGDTDEFTKEEIKEISTQYWPGNNTLIFKKENDYISFRIPDEDNVLSLLKALNVPLLTTSANISGLPPCLTKEEFEQRFPNVSLLEERVDAVKSNIPSNVYIFERGNIQKIR